MRIISICSAKGGVGKTTLTSNLGVSFVKEFYKKTVLIDGNVDGANLGLHFGINYTPRTIVDLGNSSTSIDKAIYVHQSGVRIIPAPLTYEPNFDLNILKHIVNELEDMYDITLIDSPPSIKQTLPIMEASDEILIITTPHLTATVNSMKTIEVAENLGKKIDGIVLNRIRHKNYEMTKKDVESLLNKKVISEIPEDEFCLKCLALQQPLIIERPFSKVSIEINKLVAYLLGEEYKPPNIIERIINLLGLRMPRKEQVTLTKKEKGAMLVREIEVELGDLEKLKKELGREIKEDIKKKLKKKITNRLKEEVK